MPREPVGRVRTAVSREWLSADSLAVAPLLLNLLFSHNGRVGRIVEVEAYRGSEDPASHAFRGETARNQVMFGPAGYLYVYFTYGMHFCANVVCGPPGTASAVLLRALAPIEGVEEMARARGRSGDRELCSGPARLCQALGIDRGHDGADLIVGDQGIELLDDGTEPPSTPLVGPRIGISTTRGEAASYPWRFAVPGSSYLSRRFPADPTGGPARRRQASAART